MNTLRTAARLARPIARMPATRRSMAGGGDDGKVPPYKYMRGMVEQYTSPFEVKKVETLVANFGHKAKHQTVDKLPYMAPAFIVLGITMWYTKSVNDQKYKESLF